jgi:simple sugar transport system permease protein
MTFYIFASAVIGGARLNGGGGRVISALTGVILLGLLKSILILSQIATFRIDATYGTIMLVALVFSWPPEKTARIRVPLSGR